MYILPVSERDIFSRSCLALSSINVMVSIFRSFWASISLALTDEQVSQLKKKFSYGQLYVLRMVGKYVDFGLFKDYIVSKSKTTPGA